MAGILSKQAMAPQDVPAEEARDEAMEDPAEEATEGPDAEAQEEAQEPQDEAGGQGKPNPQQVELFQLVTSRVLDALTKVGKDLDAALKADPFTAAVHFGTNALRQVIMAAEQAGKQIPFEVVFAAGLQTIKEIGEIASQKGYLQDEQIPVFLKEVLQQSLQQYTQMDVKDGRISPEQRSQLDAKMGSQQGQAPQPGAQPMPPAQPAPPQGAM